MSRERGLTESDRDRLYGVPRGEFVRARNALAARLREAGDADAAAAVNRLAKPSPPVWAINQLARAAPAAIRRLLEAVERVKAAQLGRGGDLAAASEARRRATGDLVERAGAILAEGEGRPSRETLDRVARTLLAAAIDEAAREQLRRGWLEGELSPPGFEALGAEAPRPPAPGRRKPRAERRTEARRRVRVARARRAWETARATAREATRRAEALERAAAERQKAAEEATRAADQARREAARAAAKAASAEAALRDAEE